MPDSPSDHDLLVRIDERVTTMNATLVDAVRRLDAHLAESSLVWRNFAERVSVVETTATTAAHRMDDHISEGHKAIGKRLDTDEGRIKSVEDGVSSRDLVIISALVTGVIGVIGTVLFYVVR
jgi:hypothetical protein